MSPTGVNPGSDAGGGPHILTPPASLPGFTRSGMPPPSVVRAFFALVWFSARRQWKVRQVGWVGFALLGVTTLVVGLVSNGGQQWRSENERRTVAQFKPRAVGDERTAREAVVGPAAVVMNEATPGTSQRMTYDQYVQDRLPLHALLAVGRDEFGAKMVAYGVFANLTAGKESPDPKESPAAEVVRFKPRLTEPGRLARQAVVGPAAVGDPEESRDTATAPHDYGDTAQLVRYRDDFAFTNFSRFVVFTLYVAFLLPLFTLAYAAGAIGTEREGRTLLWLITRPLPRWAVYIAKLLGMLPWCVGASVFAFAVLGLVGGEQGLKALAVFWPLAVAGGVAFGCVFHMVGALFRRPTIVALVYVFFFETLLANLPGGLKQFSLNYYLKSLFYHWLTAAAPTVRPSGLDTYEPAEPGTAWLVLVLVSVAVTALGAWLFGRQEPKDET